MVCHGYFEPDNSDYAGIMVSSGKGVPTLSAIALVPYMDIVLHQNAEHRGSPYYFSDFPFVIFPMESSLSEDQKPEVMTTAELKVGPPTNAELVALIGCHTGAGQLRAGDDFASLAYQWLKFGAASVLASGWQLARIMHGGLADVV